MHEKGKVELSLHTHDLGDFAGIVQYLLLMYQNLY